MPFFAADLTDPTTQIALALGVQVHRPFKAASGALLK